MQSGNCEEKYQLLIESTGTGFVILDERGRVLEANREYLRMTGREAMEEILGRPVTEWTAQHDSERNAAEFRRCLESGSVRGLEIDYVGKRGETVTIQIDATVLPGPPAPRIYTVCRDVSERRRIQGSLRESEERFRTLADSLPLTVFEMDLEGRFTYVNRAGVEMFGYPWGDVAGLTLEEVLVPADRKRARETLGLRLAERVSGHIEYRGLRKDGSEFPISVTASPIVRKGRPVGLRGIAMDLTERRQLEVERARSQKLESIGTLAGGIAHDFNNLLQGVFGYISLAKLNLDRPQETAALLREAESALHQAVRLTSQLLTFSKGGEPLKRIIDLRPVIENAVRFALSGSRAEYTLEVDEALAAVDADEGQIIQAIQNIVLNADQAMPGGGRIAVAVHNVRGEAGDVETVEITISDQGPGIPAEQIDRIFDPYFTTKEQGSGLGLATAYSIVRNHGGRIDVACEPGRGARFTLALPASPHPPEPVAATDAGGAVSSGRILVMDDEPAVCNVARALVLNLGHAVECVESGEEAIKAYREAMAAGRRFDVVILDLTVRGGLGGKETLEALRRIDPAVRAVVSSGYSEGAVLSRFEQFGFMASLKKPYDLSTLRSVLDRLLVE